jgi:hypothetical protein
MMRGRPAPLWWPLLTALVIAAGVVLLVVPLALRPASAATKGQASLSGPEKASLARGLTSIEALPAALAEVPAAMAHAGGKSGPAADRAAVALLAKPPELGPLSKALTDPQDVTSGLRQALAVEIQRAKPQRQPGVSILFLFGVAALPGLLITAGGVVLARRMRTARAGSRLSLWVLAGVAAAGLAAVIAAVLPVFTTRATPWGPPARPASASPQALEADVSLQQVVLDEIVPAVEDGGLSGGRLLPPGEAIQVVNSDRPLSALSRVINDSPQLYGAEVIAVGAAESAPIADTSSRARLVRDIVFCCGLLALVAGAAPLLGRVARRRSSGEMVPATTPRAVVGPLTS